MAKKKIKGYYAGSSNQWDVGEVPTCDYCNTPATKTTLHETVFSGGVCCEDEDCRLKLAADCCETEVEFIETED